MDIVKITNVETKDFDDCLKLRDKEFPEGMRNIESVKKPILAGKYALYTGKINNDIAAFQLVHDDGCFMLDLICVIDHHE